MADSLPFEQGISVGGGNGQKEINLIKQGIVKSFDLYELSEARISAGIKLAKTLSVEDKIHFIHGDAFELVNKPECYDLVHWNNSLHHMLDVNQAVEWSKKILKPNGLFFMDDFIGATRFQWPEKQLEIATKTREVFKGTKYLTNPRSKENELNTIISRPSKDKLIERDPSEAAASDQIINAVLKHFPKTEIIKTGGVIYHLALSDMLHNFDETDDKILLDLLMLIDELCIELGQTHYGVCWAIK